MLGKCILERREVVTDVGENLPEEVVNAHHSRS